MARYVSYKCKPNFPIKKPQSLRVCPGAPGRSTGYTETAPKVVFELLKARSGSIWPGWTYRDERLISPDGQDFGLYDYMEFYYLRAAVESEKAALHPQIIPQMRKKLFK
jgi:hypothetical protein